MIKFFLIHSMVIVGVAVVSILLQRRNERVFKKTHFKYMVDCFEVQNKYIKEVEILFIGASITEVYNINDFYQCKCVNRGISSDTSKGLLKRMECSIFAFEPQKIVLDFGSNDIAEGDSKEQIISNYRDIVSQIKEKLPNTKIFIQSVYPIYELKHKKVKREMVRNRSNKVFNELNGMIKELCQEINIVYIDVNSSLKDKTHNLNIDYSTDGLHLNICGYEVVTSVLKEYIMSDCTA